jgi:hypothetical protein
MLMDAFDRFFCCCCCCCCLIYSGVLLALGVSLLCSGDFSHHGEKKLSFNLYHTPSFLSSVQLARAQKRIPNPPYHTMACRFCTAFPRYRILAHAFFHHATVFRAHEAETGLCGRFVRFCLAFGLIPLNLLIVPLEEIGISEEEQRKLTLQQ